MDRWVGGWIKLSHLRESEKLQCLPLYRPTSALDVPFLRDKNWNHSPWPHKSEELCWGWQERYYFICFAISNIHISIVSLQTPRQPADEEQQSPLTAASLMYICAALVLCLCLPSRDGWIQMNHIVRATYCLNIGQFFCFYFRVTVISGDCFDTPSKKRLGINGPLIHTLSTQLPLVQWNKYRKPQNLFLSIKLSYVNRFLMLLSNSVKK